MDLETIVGRKHELFELQKEYFKGNVPEDELYNTCYLYTLERLYKMHVPIFNKLNTEYVSNIVLHRNKLWGELHWLRKIAKAIDEGKLEVPESKLKELVNKTSQYYREHKRIAEWLKENYYKK